MGDKYTDFMIKAYLAIILLLLLVFIRALYQNTTYNRYDVNGDGIVSASDYVAVKNYIMEEK